MSTVDQTLEILFAALRAASPPLGMNRRILHRCASALALSYRPPITPIRKVEPIAPRLPKPRPKP